MSIVLEVYSLGSNLWEVHGIGGPSGVACPVNKYNNVSYNKLQYNIMLWWAAIKCPAPEIGGGKKRTALVYGPHGSHRAPT